MRSLLLFAVVVTAATASTALANPSQSNPAFLGIGFGIGPGPGGCVIESVSKNGAAYDAGIQPGDMVAAIDAIALDPKRACDQLVAAITAHVPGDAVRLDVIRGTTPIVINATLTTRAEVLQRRVGKRMESTEVIDVDDVRRHIDLGERKSRTTVIGFFMQQCSGCSHMFERVADGLKKRASAAFVLGVTPGPVYDMAQGASLLRKSFASSVPLAMADRETFDALSMNDPERAFFMVTDCKGIIRLIAPLAPDSDDLEASVDEVLAAAEQAEHTRTSRR